MKAERILTAVIIALAVVFAIVWQSGMLRLGPAASAVIQISADLTVPRLDDPAMIRRGAAHYDLVCANCHASPLAPTKGDQLSLMPPAPKLHFRVDGWLPEVLFLIVKHGIPNTAMPGWPTQHRDDEVWSMVAFLRVLPDLDAASYRVLAGLDAPPAPGLVAICARCHGATGRGDASGAFPRLDIQTEDYLRDSLAAYRDGQRQSGFMAGIADLQDDAQIAALAAYFAAMPSRPAANPPTIVTQGIADRGLPACKTCHDPADVVRPQFPRLVGQYPGYLATQLRLFTDQPFTRGGGPFDSLMHKAGQGLTADDIEVVSRWYGQTGGASD